MPRAVPTNEGWAKDTIDHYRLTRDIISNFLKEKWGDYDFKVEHVGEEYRFWTKKKLSDVGDFMACQRNSKHMGLTLPQSEKDDLIDLRQAN